MARLSLIVVLVSIALSALLGSSSAGDTDETQNTPTSLSTDTADQSTKTGTTTSNTGTDTTAPGTLANWLAKLCAMMNSMRQQGEKVLQKIDLSSLMSGITTNTATSTTNTADTTSKVSRR